MMSFRTACIGAAIAAAAATFGVDLSQPLDQNTANCIVQQGGAAFGIVRAWCSDGTYCLDVPSVSNLWSAGAAHVDVYLFPCAGQDPAAQVNALVSNLANDGVQYGMIWADIESNPSDGCGWADQATNCAYYQSMVDAFINNGINYGTYASEYMWSTIMGDACTVGGSSPLWYAHYDGNPSFSDFSPFGGWSSPAIKQYDGTNDLCGFGVDSNWYPDSLSRNGTVKTA